MKIDFPEEPNTASLYGFYDQCMKTGGVQFSLGFMKPGPTIAFGTPSSFGSRGAGGAMGFADPENRVGYACMTSKMGTRLTGRSA